MICANKASCSILLSTIKFQCIHMCATLVFYLCMFRLVSEYFTLSNARWFYSSLMDYNNLSVYKLNLLSHYSLVDRLTNKLKYDLRLSSVLIKPREFHFFYGLLPELSDIAPKRTRRLFVNGIYKKCHYFWNNKTSCFYTVFVKII